MWPFRKKTRELCPVPLPEVWDWDSALAMRLKQLGEEFQETLQRLAEDGVSEFVVSFEKVGSVEVGITPLPDGSFHFQWGMWLPYEPDRGLRGMDVRSEAEDQRPRLECGTSLLEQSTRSFIFVIDGDGNSVLLWPTSLMPDEKGMRWIMNEPSIRKVPVGIGRRPEIYCYQVGRLARVADSGADLS